MQLQMSSTSSTEETSVSTPSSSSLLSSSSSTKSDNMDGTMGNNNNTNGENRDDVIKFESDSQKLVHDFCVGTNTFWKQLVIEPVRDYVEIRPRQPTSSVDGGDDDEKSSSISSNMDDVLAKLIAPPEIPGISRPVWFTILGSVPTVLIWYGYYKFCVEEELYQWEIQNSKPVTGCGGYGTLFPFVYGILVGFPLSLVPIDGSDIILKAAAFWILAGQVNLYRRVNELCTESVVATPSSIAGSNSNEITTTQNDNDLQSSTISQGTEELYQEQLNGEPPLYAWWALLPPPLDVVVGLRQVHFLSEYWRIQRGDPPTHDVIAKELFPFISSPRFTLQEFVTKPSNWFWFTKDWDDFDFERIMDDFKERTKEER